MSQWSGHICYESPVNSIEAWCIDRGTEFTLFFSFRVICLVCAENAQGALHNTLFWCRIHWPDRQVMTMHILVCRPSEWGIVCTEGPDEAACKLLHMIGRTCILSLFWQVVPQFTAPVYKLWPLYGLLLYFSCSATATYSETWDATSCLTNEVCMFVDHTRWT